MPFESFQKTCKNLQNFYEKGKLYDVQIIIENHPPPPNAKTFYAHKFFLCSQSPYFEQHLIPDDDDINDKEENVTNLLVIKDMSTEVFEVLFQYIYSSTIEFNDKSGSELFEILLGANKLKIKVLVHGIQSHLIEYQNEYLCKNFAMIYRTCHEFEEFQILLQYCNDIINNSPEIIFSALDFNSIQENLIINLLKRDELKINEIDIWNHILDWGLHRIEKLSSSSKDSKDPKTMDSNDFKILASILKNYIPLIRFIQFSSEQFKSMVRPYKKILPVELYEELIEYFLTSGIKLNSIITIPPPRHGLIDSTIITSKHTAFIASWIDRKDKQNIYFHSYECDENPYDFKLLLRGSRDNFSSTVFHEMCDNKTNTVCVMKVIGTNEILGGYNPLEWRKIEAEWATSHNSFIFSFPTNNFSDAILSRLSIRKKSISWEVDDGPSWGYDLMMKGPNLKKKCFAGCPNFQSMYERPIRINSNEFEIFDYEILLIYCNVVQVIFLDNSFPIAKSITSRLSIRKKSISWEVDDGPSWGYDLMMKGPNLKKKCFAGCPNFQSMYERPIRINSNEFEIFDYELNRSQGNSKGRPIASFKVPQSGFSCS
ncbi:hypothetical protein Glove_209g54 [Diversispora epigaea]|uniref:BTB domain-containing protein n=1 Tax=Diversispora epigaea TaxID=1348612 RepID=A0A397ISU1_9GLOM|nr:hypothetical protein Glove_209g54 [Diversispora epigaea]